MRGDDRHQEAMFSFLSPERRIPQDHPLRAIRAMVDEVLRDLSPTFDAIYSKVGRLSIPPEHLLRALLLQVLYTVRSERLLMEQLDYNLLFRWFVGLNMDEPIWDPSTYSKNRERFLAGGVAEAFFDRVLAQARQRNLLSDEHFTVDATLLEAWASLKSFRPKDEPPATPPDDPGNPTVDFHGERRRNDTHQSTTDPDARLYCKGPGREAKLCYMGHVVMENRHGLVVRAHATLATGTAEVETAEELVEQLVGDPDESAWDRLLIRVQELEDELATPELLADPKVQRQLQEGLPQRGIPLHKAKLRLSTRRETRRAFPIGAPPEI